MSKGWYWPWIVAGLLLLVMAANGILLIKATSDPSFAVEPDYYRKALDWNRTQAQARLNEDLGWEAEVAVEPLPSLPGQARVRTRITDRNELPVDGATVTLEAFHNARSSDRIDAFLDPMGDGAYAAELPMRKDGIWEFRLRAVRGHEVFTAIVDQDVTGLRP